MLKHVFQEISIGSLKLKNRFVVPPMVSNMFTPEGVATKQYAAYMEARARGGFGLLITENFGVCKGARAFPLNGGLWNDAQRDGLKDTVIRVHAAGARIAAQLYHAGRETSSAITGVPNVAPSPFQDPTIEEQPGELTVEEIRKIVREFAAAAVRAKEAGFDAVEIHCAHGYLIDEFLSPFSNKRTDLYGGPMINRARFMLETVEAVREAVGPGMPVFCRISSDELVDGGLTVQDMKAFCLLLEEAGAAAIDVSFGVFASGGHMVASYHEDHANMVKYAAVIKQACSVPVIAVGRVNDPLLAEGVIAGGEADLVAMGRASLADPDMPNKAREGRLGEIAYCIGCRQACNGNLFSGKPIGCLVNPLTGNEHLGVPKDLYSSYKILVMGGGVSGMRFAATAAARGAYVTLAEKSGKLGGQWLLALVPPHKQEYASLVFHLEQELKAHGVKILLNTEITEPGKYDLVVDATGAQPAFPDIPIHTDARVLLESEVLSGEKQARGKVFVCDFGGCAANTAAFLAAQGKDVTLVMRDKFYEKYGDESICAALEQELRGAGVTIHLHGHIREIGESILLEREALPLEPGDDVVLCTRYVKRKSVLGEAGNVIRIGDANAVGNAVTAIREAYEAACKIQ
ncbi:FAD-dependent oxidoreductase [Christensenella intestinihominis]|nr:FAD-dependent oxidoreductase [Christensenella intestinihominis]